MVAERAGADAFFHADYLAAIETVGSGGEEGMPGCETGTAAGRRVAKEGRVCLELEGSYSRVLNVISWALCEGEKVRTRSCRVVDAPCIALPPTTLILALGAGEEVREDVREPKRTLGRSEMRCPDAEGGGLAAGVEAAGTAFGNWRASGWSERAKVFARLGPCREGLLPLM